jgi:hypothetical protein
VMAAWLLGVDDMVISFCSDAASRCDVPERNFSGLPLQT